MFSCVQVYSVGSKYNITDFALHNNHIQTHIKSIFQQQQQKSMRGSTEINSQKHTGHFPAQREAFKHQQKGGFHDP